MRITQPKCPCGGEYEVKDGSIICKICGDPILSEPSDDCESRDSMPTGDNYGVISDIAHW